MNIIKIIVNNLFIQNFVSSIVALIHPYIGGTISKYSAIRKVFLYNCSRRYSWRLP